MALGETALRTLTKTLVNAGAKVLANRTSDFRLKYAMDNKLRDCALRAIEEFDVMFAAENITSAKQEWLVEQCLVELRPLLKTPEKFFAGSLSGQKLFDQLNIKKCLTT